MGPLRLQHSWLAAGCTVNGEKKKENYSSNLLPPLNPPQQPKKRSCHWSKCMMSLPFFLSSYQLCLSHLLFWYLVLNTSINRCNECVMKMIGGERKGIEVCITVCASLFLREGQELFNQPLYSIGYLLQFLNLFSVFYSSFYQPQAIDIWYQTANMFLHRGHIFDPIYCMWIPTICSLTYTHFCCYVVGCTSCSSIFILIPMKHEGFLLVPHFILQSTPPSLLWPLSPSLFLYLYFSPYSSLPLPLPHTPPPPPSILSLLFSLSFT